MSIPGRVTDEDRAKFEFDDRTRCSDTFTGKIFYPIQASLRGLFLWGGGFLYVERSALACLVLFAILMMATLFLATGRMLPMWISGPLLRDVGWEHSEPWGMALFGGAFVLVWWLSLVAGTSVAVRSLPTRKASSASRTAILLCSPIPGIGDYVRGSFWRGHLDALFSMILLVSGVGIAQIWKMAGAAPERMWEKPFLAFLAVVMASVFVLLISAWFRTIDALVLMGWVSRSGNGVKSDRKFLILGLGVLSVLGVNAFLGEPGRKLRGLGHRGVHRLKERNFHHSARFMNGSVRVVDRVAESLDDRLTMLH